MKKLVFMISVFAFMVTACQNGDTVDTKADNTSVSSNNDNAKILEQYFYEYFESDRCSVILSDLTHDGLSEMIVLETERTGDFSVEAGDTVGLTVYAVLNDEVQSIYSDYISLAHSGQRWIYLCSIDEQDYIVKYSPELFTGYGTYNYHVYSLNQDGTEHTLNYNEYHFKLPPDNAEAEMHQISEGVEALYHEVNQYIESAIPLIEVGSDYIRNIQSNYIIQRNDFK